MLSTEMYIGHIYCWKINKLTGVPPPSHNTVTAKCILQKEYQVKNYVIQLVSVQVTTARD
jgi:hypothetical protein